MSEYSSIKNLYASNGVQGKGHERGPQYGFSNPAFGSVTNWLVTEKVDGMNMRVVWEPGIDGFQVFGRTDKAVIPSDLMTHMREAFTVEAFYAAFGGYISEPGGVMTLVDAPDKVILYGEGYGPGIQKAGSAYGGEKRFILFDVNVDGHWLDWDDVVDVAEKLGVPTVPVLLRGATLETAKSLVGESMLLQDKSHVEGFVARSEPQLFDKWGQRVMFKYKVRDL